ncbi:MAG: class I SAM-dependent methyltransferase [Desulfurococcaceae archaeon]
MIHLVKPEVYDNLYREEQYMKYNCISIIINKNFKGDVIDVGCGTGLLYEYIIEANSKLSGRYICLDPVEEMLLIASNKINDYRVIFIKAYAEDPPLRPFIGDLVLSISTWGLLRQDQYLLGNLKTLARKPGIVILTGHPRTYVTRPSEIDNDFEHLGSCIDDIYVARIR